MTITKKKENEKLTLALDGRLDTTTAPELEAKLKESLGDVNDLIIDMTNLDYLSSAGLRVILTAQKEMNKKGKMTVRHVNETIMEVFEMTGFVDILVIE